MRSNVPGRRETRSSRRTSRHRRLDALLRPCWLLLVVVVSFASASPLSPVSPVSSVSSVSSLSSPDSSSSSSSSYSCAEVYSLSPRAAQCAFVLDHCIDRINDSYSTRLLSVYFCNPAAVKVGVVVASVLLLLALFKGIGLTAEKYFSVILARISQSLNLPPRLAGCTLLALGNGAPDLSSSIEAIQHGHYDLALGGLFGSVMFIGCVVAGRIITLGGVGGRGTRTQSGERFVVRWKAAQVRDVLALGVAVGCVGGIVFVKREMTVRGVSLLLGLYAGYAVLVLFADVTKRMGYAWSGPVEGSTNHTIEDDDAGLRGRLRQALLPVLEGREGEEESPSPSGSSEVELVASGVSSRDVSPSRRVTWAPGEGRSPGGAVAMEGRRTSSGHQLDSVHSGVSSTMSTMLTSPFESVDTLEETGTVEAAGGFEAALPRANTEGAGAGAGIRHGFERRGRPPPQIRPEYSQMSTVEYRARAAAALSNVRSFHRAAPLPLDEAASILNLEDLIEAMVDREEGSPLLAPGHTDSDAMADGHTTTVYLSDAQDTNTRRDGGAQSRWLVPVRRALVLTSWLGEILVMPLAFLLRATVPVVANDANDDDIGDGSLDLSWLVLSAALSPWFLTAYFSGGIVAINVPTACIATAAGSVLALAAWQAKKHPRVLDRVPVAALIGMYGFFISALWIGLIAEELVGIIHVFGVIGHIKPAVLGVTVLAWGNSLTDLMANLAIASTADGGVSMAMTACFAGPLFNLLLGIGIGFATYFSATGLSSQALDIAIVPAIGCVFALVNCVGLVAFALWYRSMVPARVGWMMMAWYGLYIGLVVAVAVGAADDV